MVVKYKNQSMPFDIRSDEERKTNPPAHRLTYQQARLRRRTGHLVRFDLLRDWMIAGYGISAAEMAAGKFFDDC